jgi:hypothetical protein
MPTLPSTVNRYRDLLVLVPGGEFYKRSGIVIPYSNKPTDLHIATSKANYSYLVYINGRHTGFVETNANSEAVFSRQLDYLENEINLVDPSTGERFKTYLTTADYATWLAAFANQFEKIDLNIEAVRIDRLLEQVDNITDASAIFGSQLNQENTLGYTLEAYREVLQELRQSYRIFGGKLGGIEQVIGTFTQVPSLVYDRRWDGPDWILGSSFISNGNFLSRTERTFSDPVNITGLEIISIDSNNNSGTGTLTYTDLNTALQWTPPGRNIGRKVFAAAGGEFTLWGEPIPGYLVSTNYETYDVSVKNYLSINVNNRGIIDIDISVTAVSPLAATAAEIATDINNALVADSRYGATFSTFASSYAANDGNNYLRMITPNLVFGSAQDDELWIEIERYSISANDASNILFGTIEYPLRESGTLEYDSITITFDTFSRPPGDRTDSITVTGNDRPEGWFFDASATVELIPGGVFNEGRLSVSATSTLDVYRKVNPRALKYKGFIFDFGTWFNNPGTSLYNVRMDFSFDGGSTWETTSPHTVNPTPGNVLVFFRSEHILRNVTDSFWVRFHITNLGSPGTVVIEEARLLQKNVSALFSGTNTVTRNRSRQFYGELLYLWSPDILTNSEKFSLGLPFPGHIDLVGQAHSQVDRFDVTEYDSSDDPKNLKGVFTEADLLTGALTNLEVIIRTPARMSYLKPSSIGRILSESLTFSLIPPYVTTLSMTSNEDIDSCILYQDGVAVPNNTWQFNSSTEIQINSGYSSSSVYTLDYNLLFQFESLGIDLGSSYANYLWFVDYYKYGRLDANSIESLQTVAVVFNPSTFRAALPRRSNKNQTAAQLLKDTGSSQTILQLSQWSFVDDKTINIDSGQYDPKASYFLTHEEVVLTRENISSCKFEVRQATTLLGLGGASYSEVERNSFLDITGSLRYVQFRITIQNITDVRDIRLKSMCAKGLNLFGINGYVPGLRFNEKIVIPSGYSSGSGDVISSYGLFDVQKSNAFYSTVNTARRAYGIAFLPTIGKVLIFGGTDTVPAPIDSSELFDFVTKTWSLSGTLSAERSECQAIVLDDGDVITSGGVNLGGTVVATGEKYSASGGTWASITSMADERWRFGFIKLDDSTVLACGGRDSGAAELSSAEIYDQGANTWSSVGSMSKARTMFSAVKMEDGKVLIIGGAKTSGVDVPMSECEIYDPYLQTFSSTGSLSVARYQAKAHLLNNGKVLVIGGKTSSTASTASCEIYDPNTGIWSAAQSMNYSRGDFSSEILKDGRVIVMGGFQTGSSETATVEIYDPVLNTWDEIDSLDNARQDFGSTICIE